MRWQYDSTFSYGQQTDVSPKRMKAINGIFIRVEHGLFKSVLCWSNSAPREVSWRSAMVFNGSTIRPMLSAFGRPTPTHPIFPATQRSTAYQWWIGTKCGVIQSNKGAPRNQKALRTIKVLSLMHCVWLFLLPDNVTGCSPVTLSDPSTFGWWLHSHGTPDQNFVVMVPIPAQGLDTLFHKFSLIPPLYHMDLMCTAFTTGVFSWANHSLPSSLNSRWTGILPEWGLQDWDLCICYIYLES